MRGIGDLSSSNIVLKACKHSGCKSEFLSWHVQSTLFCGQEGVIHMKVAVRQTRSNFL